MVGGEGVEVGEGEVAGAVGVVGLLFVAFDDGEGGVDVADGVAVGDAVEVEEEGVELGAEAEAASSFQGKGGRGFPASSMWPRALAKGAMSVAV